MWIYKGKELTTDDIPDKAVGFCYVIQHKTKDIKYLGRKLLTKAATKTVNGIKKKIRKESDWKDYWGSSPYFLEVIEQEGKDNFTREILIFAYGKGELNYIEEDLMHKLDVLIDTAWVNNNIRSKIFRKNVIKYKSIEEVETVLSRFSKNKRTTQPT